MFNYNTCTVLLGCMWLPVSPELPERGGREPESCCCAGFVVTLGKLKSNQEKSIDCFLYNCMWLVICKNTHWPTINVGGSCHVLVHFCSVNNVMKSWRRLPIGETVTAEPKIERDLLCNSRQVCTYQRSRTIVAVDLIDSDRCEWYFVWRGHYGQIQLQRFPTDVRV